MIGDWWYDDVSHILVDYTYSFDDFDWEYLMGEVVNLPPVSQEKLLYTIDEVSPFYGFKIGIMLLGSKNNTVVNCALSTVNQCFDQITIDNVNLQILNEFEDKIPDNSVASKIYQELKKKIEMLGG